MNKKITKENAVTIFKLRSRETEEKLNYRGKYEILECELCHDEVPEFSQLMDGKVNIQLEIAKIFTENIKRKKECLDKS